MRYHHEPLPKDGFSGWVISVFSDYVTVHFCTLSLHFLHDVVCNTAVIALGPHAWLGHFQPCQKIMEECILI